MTFNTCGLPQGEFLLQHIESLFFDACRLPRGVPCDNFSHLISVNFSRFFCMYLLFWSRMTSGCFLRYLLFCSRKISGSFSRYLFLCSRCFRFILINSMRDLFLPFDPLPPFSPVRSFLVHRLIEGPVVMDI